MEAGSLSERIYAFIGANAWYLTFGLYALIALLQTLLGGGFSLRRRRIVVAPAASTKAE